MNHGRPLWLRLGPLVFVLIASIVPAVLLSHRAGQATAHATSAHQATIAVSPGYAHPGQPITVTGQGFAPNTNGTLLFQGGLTQAAFPCNSRGRCSGVINAATGIVGGSYSISAPDGQGTGAQATVVIEPSLQRSPTRGGVGSFIQLQGDGLVADETLTLYWGSPSNGINEGSGTVSSHGTFGPTNFSAPLNAAPGMYPISAVESSHPTRPLRTWFRVLPARINGPGGFRNGNSVTVKLSNFAPGEGVSISWNANGGQLLAGVDMNESGAGSASFTPPTALEGSYTLTATGHNSDVTATTPLAIGPGIAVSPIPDVPGSTVTVTGGGFAANEALGIYFQKTSNGVTRVTTDAQGNFTAPLVLPGKYQPGTNYAIYAAAISGTDHAHVPFTFTTPVMGVNAFNAFFGEQLNLVAEGFAVGEKINLFWNYGQTGQLLAQTFTADGQGSLNQTVTTPSDPNLNTVAIAAVGVQSGLIATSSLQETGNLIVTPNIANPGQTVQVQAGGLGSIENTSVTFNGTTVATGTTDASGLLSTSFVVPPSSQYGFASVNATGSTSGVEVSDQFLYNAILTLSPTSGPSGTVVTVNGSQFVPSSTLHVIFYLTYCSCFGASTDTTSSATGTFTTTITVPSGIVGGLTYPVWANYDYTYPSDGIANFTVQ
ncbi:MAG TPA: hypothetical protein VJO32_06820 [Ktedonobacteraceae bacterium]|nr:hypothetical protein [Ktedonobacteraceae bacterium]